MRSAEDVERVFARARQGASKATIALETGVSRAQVRAWLDAGYEATLHSPMRAQRDFHGEGACPLVLSVDPKAYAYLLGQYLGDGCISAVSRGGYRLRVSTSDAYPAIRRECSDAIATVLQKERVGIVQAQGCAQLYAYSQHCICLFPQHGPGRKHERSIQLEPWQELMALEQHPDLFVRGLIHSDGCRVLNRVHVRGRGYAYPRYFFTNSSVDIRRLFSEACDELGIEWRQNNATNISVSRRDSVALMDQLVGPKT